MWTPSHPPHPTWGGDVKEPLQVAIQPLSHSATAHHGMGLTKHTHPPPGRREAELAAIKEKNPTLCPTLLWKEGAAPHTQCFFFLEVCRSPHTP